MIIVLIVITIIACVFKGVTAGLMTVAVGIAGWCLSNIVIDMIKRKGDKNENED